MWHVPPDPQAQQYTQKVPDTDEKLDRALVAGLILEIMLESPGQPPDHREYPSQIKHRLQNSLIEHLAGKVTLDRFRSLASRLDNWFEYYYPLLIPETRNMPTAYTVAEPAALYLVREPTSGWRTTMTSPTASSSHRPVFWEELLDRWLAELDEQLPRRSHRKVSPGKLRDFLQQTGGGWFKVRDFERFFQVDRKTAWDYLQQFLQAGLVCHNRRQSAAVRYCASPQLLKVEADTLRLALYLALPEMAEEMVERLGDLLVASAGETFPEREWQSQFSARQLEQLLESLKAHHILSIQVTGNGVRLLRLRSRWLQSRPFSHQN